MLKFKELLEEKKKFDVREQSEFTRRKKLGKGKEPAKKKNSKRSLYSDSQVQSGLETFNEESLNADNNEFKTADGRRNYDFFRRIIRDQSKTKHFIRPTFKYEEDDIVVVNNASLRWLH